MPRAFAGLCAAAGADLWVRAPTSVDLDPQTRGILVLVSWIGAVSSSSTTNGPSPSPRPRTFRIATRAATREEFVDSFWRFIDEESIFLAMREPPTVGRRHPFRITLQGGEPMLVGEGEVVDSITDGSGKFARNGMRMRFVRIDESSRAMHRELLSRRLSVTPHPRPMTGAPVGPMPPPPRTFPDASPPPDRAPGATATLPANPFSQLPDSALEHFVECVLYEDTGVLTLEPGVRVPEGAAPGTPVRADTPLPSTTPPPSGTPLPAPSALTPPPTPPPAPLPAPPHGPPPRAPSLARRRTQPPNELSGIMPPGWASGEVPSFEDEYEPEKRYKLWKVLALASGVTLVIGLGLGWVLWGGRTAHAPLAGETAAAAPAAADVPAAPVARPHAAEPAPPAPKEAAPARPPAPVAAAPAPASGECVASINSTPPGVKATVGAVALGPTPVAAAHVPCHGTLVLEHPRYDRFEKQLALTAGKPETFNLVMTRPQALLTLSSTPPGAAITVNGVAAGKTPATVKLPAFTNASIALALTGHKPWQQKVYVKGKKQALSAALESLQKPKGKGWLHGVAVPAPAAKKPAPAAPVKKKGR